MMDIYKYILVKVNGMDKLTSVKLSKEERKELKEYGGIRKFIQDKLKDDGHMNRKVGEIALGVDRILDKLDNVSSPAPVSSIPVSPISELGGMNDKMKAALGGVVEGPPALVPEKACDKCGEVYKKAQLNPTRTFGKQVPKYFCDSCMQEQADKEW